MTKQKTQVQDETNGFDADTQPITNEVATTSSNSLEVGGFSNFDALSAALDQSEDLDQKEVGIVMTSEYFQLKKEGDKFRGVFAGLTEIQVKDKGTDSLVTLPAVRLIYNRQMYVNAGAALVKEFSDGFISVGQMVEVIFTKTVGNTKIYSVSILR